MTVVKGLNVRLANNEEEALNLLFEGETNRVIAEHALNHASSRSHCVFTVHIEVLYSYPDIFFLHDVFCKIVVKCILNLMIHFEIRIPDS